MTKAEILSEIRRTAAENGGSALGFRNFERETGIRQSDWLGVYWRGWGDAVREAGLQANTLTSKIDEGDLLRKYAELARALGRTPTQTDLRLMRRRDKTFPSDVVFTRRFGSYAAVRARTLEWCTGRPTFADVVPLVSLPVGESHDTPTLPSSGVSLGFVYLIKHGSRSDYKIGRTVNPIRREGELRLQLPETVKPVHYIKTDDPAGVEAYWHSRFSAKRKEGEWFALTAADVRAFKKWQRIS